MRSTPIGMRLPCPATHFKQANQSPITQMNGEPINLNAEKEYYDVLRTWQDKYIKGSDTQKDLFSIPIGCTVAVQHEDGGPWTQGIMEEMNDTDQPRWSYIIRVMKTGRLIMCNTRHICRTPTTIEQYLWEQIKKGTGLLEEIFTEARLLKHNWVSHSYTIYTQMHTLQDDRQRKVPRTFPSSRAQNLTPGILCLMANWTVPLEVLHHRT